MMSTTSIRPRRDLPADARRAWNLILPRLEQHGVELLPIDASMLELLCAAYADYQRALDEMRARPADDPRQPFLADIAEIWRLHAREGLAEFMAIPHERINTGAVNDEGVDADLARWFSEKETP